MELRKGGGKGRERRLGVRQRGMGGEVVREDVGLGIVLLEFGILACSRSRAVESYMSE